MQEADILRHPLLHVRSTSRGTRTANRSKRDACLEKASERPDRRSILAARNQRLSQPFMVGEMKWITPFEVQP